MFTQVRMAQRFGHQVDCAHLLPLRLATRATSLYQTFKQECKHLSKEMEAYLKPTIQKHFFQSTSPSIICHLCTLCSILTADGELPTDWNVMGPGSVLSLPSWLAHHLYSLRVIKTEMVLAPELRSNPPVQMKEGSLQANCESVEKSEPENC